MVDAASVVLNTCVSAHTSPQLPQKGTNVELKLLQEPQRKIGHH